MDSQAASLVSQVDQPLPVLGTFVPTLVLHDVGLACARSSGCDLTASEAASRRRATQNASQPRFDLQVGT